MCKRISAVLLLISVLISGLVFSASAAEGDDHLVISECDSLDGWTGTNLSVTDNAAQACGSAAAINRNCGYGVFAAGYEMEPTDISDYTYIEWDMMYMLNGDTTGALWELVKAAYSSEGRNNTLYMRLSSEGSNNDRAIWRSSALEITQPYENKNWFHFKAEIAAPNGDYGFDPSKCTGFYFTTCDAGSGYYDTSIGNGAIRIDNIYATGKKEQPVVPGDANGDVAADITDLIRVKKYLAGSVSEVSAGADMNSNGVVNNFDMVCLRKLLLGIDYSSDVEETETVMINDCEELTGWTQENANTGIAIQPDRGVDVTSALYAFGGYGALRRITYTPDSAIDLSSVPTLEWDQYTVVSGGENNGLEQFDAVYGAYQDYAAVAVSDGSKTVAFDISKWQISDPGDGNYRHIMVSLAGSGLDLGNVTSIEFYTLPQGTGQPAASVPNTVFRFDRIIATSNSVAPNWSGNPDEPGDAVPDIEISDCENTSGWSYENGNQNIIVGTNLGIDGAYVSVTTGYGALRRLTYTPASGLDLSNNPTLEWDMVITETSNGLEYFYAAAEAYSATAGIEVSDGSETALIGVTEWQVGASDGNKWRHISASLAGRGLDLSNITSITFVMLPAGQGAVNSGLSANVIYRFDNIIATDNASESNWNGAGDNTGTAFMPSMFSDGMLFQQNKDINLWGITDEANETVEVQLYREGALAETQTTVSDGEGNWSVALSPREGGYEKYSIQISAGNQSKLINDVLIGELWIAAGQSNMEFFLGNTVLPSERDTIPLDEYIRVFKEPSVPTADGADGVLSSVPVYDIIPDVNNVNSIGGAVWSDAGAEPNIRYVSAIAYYTCLELREALDVPVGFINTAKGASVIESWLSRESIDSNETVKSKLEEMSLYMSERGLNAPRNWQYMTTLYNTKLAPLAGLNADNEKRSEHAGFNIAGVMWYQGESNVKYADDDGSNPYYTAALNQLIDDWSVIFGFEKGEMPFIFADIAAYDYSNVRPDDYDVVIPMLSEAMADASAAHSNTAVQIPIYDLPLTYRNPPAQDYHPIHPSDKKSVAERFADAVLGRFYGIGEDFAAPVFKEIEISGDKLIITLDNVGGGLAIRDGGGTLYGFAVCGSDRVFVNADARIISSNQIEVSSPYVSNPVAATYAFSSYNANANLVNSSGTPCLPFRTDRTESVYLGADDWMSADIEEVWSSSCQTLVGDMYSTWVTDTSGASISFDAEVKASGASSIKLTTTSASKGAGPNLALSSIRNHLSDYKYLAVTVKNDDGIDNTLRLRIGSGAYALTVDGGQGAALAANSDFTTYVFDLSELVDSNGNPLSTTMYNNAFSQDELTFVLDAAGTVHIDEIRLATELSD